MSIPMRFRDLIATRYTDRIVVTNFDRCLVAYPLEEWEALERKAGQLPQLKKQVRSFERYFISGAAECPIDRQGRILIPSSLREFAEIEKSAVVVGILTRFEIWSKERWQKEFTQSQQSFEDSSEVLGELGI